MKTFLRLLWRIVWIGLIAFVVFSPLALMPDFGINTPINFGIFFGLAIGVPTFIAGVQRKKFRKVKQQETQNQSLGVWRASFGDAHALYDILKQGQIPANIGHWDITLAEGEYALGRQVGILDHLYGTDTWIRTEYTHYDWLGWKSGVSDKEVRRAQAEASVQWRDAQNVDIIATNYGFHFMVSTGMVFWQLDPSFLQSIRLSSLGDEVLFCLNDGWWRFRGTGASALALIASLGVQGWNAVESRPDFYPIREFGRSINPSTAEPYQQRRLEE